MEQKKFVTTLIAIAVALFAGYYMFTSFSLSGNYNQSMYAEEGASGLSSPNNIVFFDQSPGKTLRAADIRLSEIGFVVIYEIKNGRIVSKVGQSLLLPPGDYRNIQIDLDREVSSGTALSAVLYHDSGDGVFTTAVDIPVTDSRGNAITEEFMISDDAPPSTL